MPDKHRRLQENLNHGKSVVRFFTLLILLLAFLFFTNDFGFIEVQKTYGREFPQYYKNCKFRMKCSQR